MDDLTNYSKNAEGMERCKILIAQVSKDIIIYFGLDKCAVAHILKRQNYGLANSSRYVITIEQR